MLALRTPPLNADPLTALRRGDTEAITQVYREHADALLALACRLTGSREDAEDVVHDVFVGLPEALRRYEESGRFGSWVKRITARRALMQCRKRADRRETPTGIDAVPARESIPDRRAVRMDVAAALNRLTPTLRAVFVLKVIEGYSHQEIAQLLGITAGTSETRLCRAMAQLRSLLEP